MIVRIDESSGFCWGVVKTIDKVEEVLKQNSGRDTYVLGQIIHNPMETERLTNIGLKTVTHEGYANLEGGKNDTVIIRAHGEPPETYAKAKELGINLIDATCPLVQTLQKSVRKYYDEGWQIVLFGKEQHAEVVGLHGVCNNESIVVGSVEEAMEKVDYSKNTVLFSQTTMDGKTFDEIRDALEKKLIISGKTIEFLSKNTICRFVSGRVDSLIEFAEEHDTVVFVAGKNSSNGKSLYHICKEANEQTIFIESIDELDYNLLNGKKTVGVTGATSTPQWYMELVKEHIEKHFA